MIIQHEGSEEEDTKHSLMEEKSNVPDEKKLRRRFHHCICLGASQTPTCKASGGNVSGNNLISAAGDS
jgi:hypothetical protein